MKILIPGGTGFIGSWLKRTMPPNLGALFLSRADYYACGGWANQKWDACIHIAPVSPTYILKKCKRVLFISSGAVYEGQSDYAKTKRRQEQHVMDRGRDWVIARLFAFIGEGLKDNFAVTNFINDAKSGRPIQVWGDGSAIRTYLYGPDLGRWLWKILLEGSGIYDVGGSVEITTLELARMVSDIIPSRIEIVNKPGVPNTRYVPNLERAHELGCEETVGIREALERMIKG